MRFNFVIPAADLPIANAPEIGSEWRLSLSYETLSRIGEISQPAVASGVWSPETPAFEFPVDGVDLQLVCRNGIRSSTPIIVSLNVTLEGNTAAVATATFAVPSYAKDQSSNLPIGLAVDLIPQGGGNANKKIIAVVGIASVAGGEPNNRFILVNLPSVWNYVGCTRKLDETLPLPTPLAIPCGSNASAYTKNGRGEPGALSAEALAFSYAAGLSRMNGHTGSVMVEIMKDDRVLSERTVYTGVRLKTNTPRGDGDDNTVANAVGVFEDFLKFV